MSRLRRGLAEREDRSSPYLPEDELREDGRSFARRCLLKSLVMCPFQIGLSGGYFLRGGRIVKIHYVFPAGHSALAPDF